MKTSGARCLLLFLTLCLLLQNSIAAVNFAELQSTVTHTGATATGQHQHHAAANSALQDENAAITEMPLPTAADGCECDCQCPDDCARSCQPGVTALQLPLLINIAMHYRPPSNRTAPISTIAQLLRPPITL